MTRLLAGPVSMTTQAVIGSVFGHVIEDGAFSPLDLFASGEDGVLYESFDISTLWQDVAGTTQVAIATDTAARGDNKAGNGGPNWLQVDGTAEPMYQTSPARLVLDKVDDAITIDVPVGGWTGTMVLATTDGTAAYSMALAAGTYTLGGQYFPGSDIVGLVIRDGAMAAQEISDTIAYFGANGASASYAGYSGSMERWFLGDSALTSVSNFHVSSLVTSLEYMFYDCTNIAEIDFTIWDTSNVLSMYYMFYRAYKVGDLDMSALNVSSVQNMQRMFRKNSGLTSFTTTGWNTGSVTSFLGMFDACSNLTLLDISHWDFSSVTSMAIFVNGCGNLATLTVGTALTNSTCVDYNNAFLNCGLGQQSVDDILVSIDNAGTSNGDLSLAGGTSSTPSAAGLAAKSNLQGRGWTVTTN